MRAALALLFVSSQAQRQPFDDYLRVADPCRPNNCPPPQICIRVKCDTGMCAQCTMTTFSTNPEDDLPGLGKAPSSAQSLPAPTPALSFPTPFNPSQLVTRPPATPPSPALVARSPSTQTQPVSYPYVDPPGTPQQPASYPYVDPSSISPLTPRGPTPSLYPDAQDPFAPQLTPRNPQNSPYDPSAGSTPARPVDTCGPRASCYECAQDGMCGWDRGRCVVRCAVACVRDVTKCPPDTTCSSSTCSACIGSGCVWSAGVCQPSCMSAPCIGSVESCPALLNACSARTCGECTNLGCIWSSNGCQVQCRGASCVSLSAQCPRGAGDMCSQSKTCGECTGQGCKWSMNSCGSVCQRNQEDNIICWDTASMCPGACVTCNDPFPSCPPGCSQCQQIGQTCNTCAKAVCLDNSPSPSAFPQGGSSSSQCAIGLPCDACAASGCTWSVSTGCIACRSPPCSSPCAPALPGSSPFAPSASAPPISTKCNNDGQCLSEQFCNAGKCQAYAAAGTVCSLTGTARCLPPAQCVYIGNPFKPENANINLLFCMRPGQDMSNLLSQVQQQAQVKNTPAPSQQPTRPPTPSQQQLLEQQQLQQQQQLLLQQQQQYAQMLQPQITVTPSSPCCQNRTQPGCPSDLVVQSCVCALDSFCCARRWDGGCAELAARACSVQCQPQCDGVTCGECLSGGCRWVVPADGSPGSCARSCSALSGWNCHTSSCPDPCLANPCPYGQKCAVSSACAKPPCFTCSSQPSLKPGSCPVVGNCDVDYESSECSSDSQCEGASKCCMQPFTGGFVIQPSVRSFVSSAPKKGKANKTAATTAQPVVARRSSNACQWRCMLPNLQCEVSSDCLSSQYCSDSQCTEFLEEGMPCSARTRCRNPLACTQGVCRRADASLSQAISQPLAVQPSCRSDEDCGIGTFCQEQSRDGVSICQPFRAEGLTCGEISPVWKCFQPLVCLAPGVCRSSDYCSSNAECPQTAQCVSNKCTPIKQSCCEENLGATGCTDLAIEACVCATDSSCCSVAWDKTCTKTAQQQCGATCQSAALWVAPGFGVNPCCGLQKIGGCGDMSVDGNCACKVDNFCCDNVWDYKCINIASQKCGLTCPS